MNVYASTKSRLIPGKGMAVLIAGMVLLGLAGPAMAEKTSGQTPAAVSEELRELDKRLMALDRRFDNLERQVRSQASVPFVEYRKEPRSWINEYKERQANSGN